MNIIVAVDKNWGIGKEGKLLARIPADLKQFKEKTLNKVVVMGRKTLESFPNAKPLPNRINIVLTNNRKYNAEGVILAYSYEEALELLSQYKTEDIFIIGGGSIYRLFEPICDKAYVSKIDNSFEIDTSFPNLDNSDSWSMKEKGEAIESNGYVFEVCTYIKTL